MATAGSVSVGEWRPPETTDAMSSLLVLIFIYPPTSVRGKSSVAEMALISNSKGGYSIKQTSWYALFKHITYSIVHSSVISQSVHSHINNLHAALQNNKNK